MSAWDTGKRTRYIRITAVRQLISKLKCVGTVSARGIIVVSICSGLSMFYSAFTKHLFSFSSVLFFTFTIKKQHSVNYAYLHRVTRDDPEVESKANSITKD